MSIVFYKAQSIKCKSVFVSVHISIKILTLLMDFKKPKTVLVHEPCNSISGALFCVSLNGTQIYLIPNHWKLQIYCWVW
jgi:hypothetical protein